MRRTRSLVSLGVLIGNSVPLGQEEKHMVGRVMQMYPMAENVSVFLAPEKDM